MDREKRGDEAGRKETRPAAAAGAQGDGEAELARSDMVKLQAAVNSGWDVSADLKARLIARLEKLISSPQTSTRTLLSCGRLLASITAQDEPQPPAVAVQVVNVRAPGELPERSEADRRKIAEVAAMLLPVPKRPAWEDDDEQTSAPSEGVKRT